MMKQRERGVMDSSTQQQQRRKSTRISSGSTDGCWGSRVEDKCSFSEHAKFESGSSQILIGAHLRENEEGGLEITDVDN